MMSFKISRRNAVRIISFSAAILLILGGVAFGQLAAARDYRSQLENAYTRSLGELSTYLYNIATDLDKGRYVGTGGQLAQLSARVWRESAGAKSALSTLPVGDLHLDSTYKFLSQVGDYAMAISKKVSQGQSLTEEETQNAEALRRYAVELRDYVDQVQQQAHDGRIEITALRAHSGDDTEGTKPAGVAAGFQDAEQTMTGYPTLIYDGPFSDHLLSERPKLTRGMAAVDVTTAKEIAAKAARLKPDDLTRGDDENSNMASYTFKAKGIGIGVTKAGGIVTYLINSREIGDERLSLDAAFRFGRDYLEALGLEAMRNTYYEISDGICTINYACTAGDIVLYTDLIKIGVALDDGGIVFYDARGYISNHQERTIPTPMISEAEAAKSVNPSLRILSVRLALIPTSGKNEKLTYEFQVETNDEEKQKLLVYVNAANGAEEQILLLLQSAQGTLTK